MGGCTSKPQTGSTFSDHYNLDIPTKHPDHPQTPSSTTAATKDELEVSKKSPFFPFYSPSPGRNWFSKKSSPAKSPAPNETDSGSGLDKSFRFSKHFGSKYEIGEEVGRGHFGYTCKAKFKKGEFKGQDVAVKVIPKSKVCC